MERSFSSSTESIAHDSDPKYLTFERLSDDPSLQTGEGHVTEVIGNELPLFTLESGDEPGDTGPRLEDLTEGVTNSITLQFEPPVHNSDLVTTIAPHAVTFSQLNGGSITFDIGLDDASVLSITKTAIQLSALAVAQGNGSLSEAFIDLTGTTLPLGRTIVGPVTATCTVDFASSNGLNTALSLSEGLILQDSLGANEYLLTPYDSCSLTHDSTVSQISIAPYVILPSSHLLAQFKLVGSTASGGVATVTFNLDNSTSIGPFQITTNALKTLATSQGVLGQSHINVSNVDLGWDLSGLSGRTIISIDWAITTAFASSGYLLGDPSSLAISYGSSHDTITNVNATGTYHHVNPIDGWGADTPVFTIGGVWVSDSSVWETLEIDVDASSVLSNAEPSQMTLQSTGVIIDGGSIFSFFETHVGWTINGLASSNMVANYGPSSIHSPSVFRLAIKSGEDETPSYDVISSFNPLDVAGTFTNTMSSIEVDETTRVEFRVSLFPHDSQPVYGSTVVTEPYEIRHRNLPLFKLFPTGSPSEGLTFDIAMFGSQGTPDKNDNSLREWCPLPFNVVKGSGLTANVVTASILIDQHSPNLPDNFGGVAVFPTKEVVGPWNYIRFVLKPSEGKVNADYNDCFLIITANARELL